MHTVSCIVRPWALTYSEHFEAIKEDSIRLDKLSDMATKAELRDTHLEVTETRKEWAVTNSELRVLRDDNQRLTEMTHAGMGRLDQTIICEYQCAWVLQWLLTVRSIAQRTALRLPRAGRHVVFHTAKSNPLDLLPREASYFRREPRVLPINPAQK